MPKPSLQNLRELIETAGELTPEHRDELRRIAMALEAEVHPILDSGGPDSATGNLREAINLTGELVKNRGSAEMEDLPGKLEIAVEKVAIEHPTIAGILTALGKLV